MADPVSDRRRPWPCGDVDAPRYGRDRTVRGQRRQGQSDQEPPHADAARVSESVAQLIGVTLLSTLCYYTFFSALTPFAVKGNGIDDGRVFWALSIATALFVALQYPFGWTADRFGRKPQMLLWSGAIVPNPTLIRPEAGFGSVLLVFCF